MAKHYTTPARHRWFDDWRGARGPALKKLVADITAEVEALETRKRKRKAVDQRHFEAAVEVVVSNLAHEVLCPSETGFMAIITGHGDKGFTRYDNKALGKPLRTLLGALAELDMIEWGEKPQGREAWSLAPTEAFRERVHSAGVLIADIGRAPGEETILLSMKVPLGPDASGARKREWISYLDTAETIALRRDLEALNAFLASADVAFVDDGLGVVDASDRRMRRHFVVRPPSPGIAPTVSFDLSGRLFGGFWQSMTGTRRAGIRINGEPVADLDYGQMAIRLAYASVGAAPPEGDMYALPGLDGHRPAVKRAFNTLLNAGAGITRWGTEATEEREDVDPSAVLPAEWTVAKTKAAILAQHPALAPCLGSGIGLKLMHMESEILMAVLIEMMARGIVGLGNHDGLLTPASKADEVREIMEEMAVLRAGTTIPVTVEALSL